MKTLNAELLDALTANVSAPCLSIYLPVHANVAERSLDTLTLKNLIKDIRSSIGAENVHAMEELLKPVESLLQDKSFLAEKEGTLAIFSSPKLVEVVSIPETHDPSFYVDECFYVLPLLEFMSNNKPFQVLAIGKNQVRLFEGDRYHFDEVALEGEVPTSMKAALGHDLTDNHLHAAAGGSAAIHGYMEITDERDTDNTRFFRMIDQAIHEKYCKANKIPLLLAALPENQSLFHALSKNDCLLQESIALNADSIDKDDLHQRALGILEKQKEQHLEKQLDRFATGKSEKLATEDVADIARHAMDSRIERLFITRGKRMPGTISLEDRKIKPNKDSYADIINKIALLTHKHGGKVHTLETADSNLPTGIGSLNRF